MPRRIRPKGNKKVCEKFRLNPRKLNEDIAKEILTLVNSYKMTQEEVCKWVLEKYGVAIQRTTISHIVTGKRWGGSHP